MAQYLADELQELLDTLPAQAVDLTAADPDGGTAGQPDPALRAGSR
jgi:hypothetical protein